VEKKAVAVVDPVDVVKAEEELLSAVYLMPVVVPQVANQT
jgi:hypothetical protein